MMLRKSVPKRVGSSTAAVVPAAPDKKTPLPSPLSAAVAPAVPFAPATDLLGHTTVLEYRAVYPLLGVPVEVRTNSPAVHAAAERAFGGWRDLDADRITSADPLQVDVIVHAGRPWELRPSSFVWRAHGDCFLGAAESNVMTAQMDRGHALAFVTPELVHAELLFRRMVLECLALLLVGRRDRTPLHAAALVRNDRTLVLAGPSGSGKSTLCYAGLKADFQLLAEEVLYVSVGDGVRLWGIPWQLHLPSDAPRLFPELSAFPTEQQPSGKLKIALDTARFGAERLCRFAERPLVCLIQRQRRPSSSLEPIDRRTVVEACTRREPGFDLYPQAAELAGLLAEGGAYRLNLGTDLAGAVKRLQELTES